MACKKEPVHKVDPSFIGIWKHAENNNEFWYLDIGKKSSGTITLYDSLGNTKHGYGENPRRWRVKTSENLLFHGQFNKKFHIDLYPQKAQQSIINEIDTIQAGKVYMILDGDYYVK